MYTGPSKIFQKKGVHLFGVCAVEWRNMILPFDTVNECILMND